MELNNVLQQVEKVECGVYAPLQLKLKDGSVIIVTASNQGEMCFDLHDKNGNFIEDWVR